MKSDRKVLRLVIDLERLLMTLRRDGHLDKSQVSADVGDLISGETLLPDDARLIGAHVDGDCGFLFVDIESDSAGPASIGRLPIAHARINFPQKGEREAKLKTSSL